MNYTILPRSSWTTTAPGFPRYPHRKLDRAAVRGVVLHYPAMGRAVGKLTQAAEAAWWRGFRNFHVNTRGWADIGYNFGVTQAGRIYTLAGDTHASAHAATAAYQRANHEWLGICLLIGDDEEPTPELVAAVNALWAHEKNHRGFTNATRVLGHQEVLGAFTRCPGPRVMAGIRAGRFRPATAKPPARPTSTRGTYLVRPGDTLGAIARDHGTSVRALVFLNGLPDPDRIEVGQRLFTRWVVSRGQTLGGIAKAAGTTASRLAKLNGLADANRIDVGQLIKLP